MTVEEMEDREEMDGVAEGDTEGTGDIGREQGASMGRKPGSWWQEEATASLACCSAD